MAKKKGMSTKYISFALIVIVVLGIASYLIYTLTKETPAVVKTEIAKKIPEYDYSLDDRDTKIMQEEFENLNNILKQNPVDDKAYASAIAKLYIIDLYTLNNKINSFDTACLEYVYPPHQDNYRLNQESTLYKSIIDNSDGKRKQTLPEVETVEIIEIKDANFPINNKDVFAYEISLRWTYKEELGYDSSATLTLVKDKEKIYVVKHEALKETQKNSE